MANRRREPGRTTVGRRSEARLAPVGPTDQGVGANEHSRHRDDIQGLRGLAVLLVVIYHAKLGFSGGFVGVDVFFVISGFVITEMLLAEYGETQRISLKDFYLRRVRRLLPALAVALTITMVLLTLIGPIAASSLSLGTGVGAALFAANLQLFWFARGGYFDVAADQNSFLHTWSLSVEEQFYFVFPALLILGLMIGMRWRRPRPRRAAAGLLGTVIAASFCLSWLMSTGRSPISDRVASSFAFYSSLTRAWEFGVGALLALATGIYSERKGWSAGAAAWIGGGLLAWSALTYTSGVPFPGVAALAPVVGTGLMLGAGKATPRNGPSRLLSTKPMVWIGDRSYGWYLWHWPLIVFGIALWPKSSLAPTIAALLALGGAAISYAFVENPVRFGIAFKSARRTVQLACICVAVPVVVAVGLSAGIRSLDSVSQVKDLKSQLAEHADIGPDCPGGRSLQSAALGCTWRVHGATRTAILIGDSNAGHITEPFVAAANKGGFNATVATIGGCPFATLTVKNWGVTDENCQRFVQEALRELASDPPDVIVVAMAADRYFSESRFSFVDPVTGREEGDAEGKSALWARGLGDVLRRLEDAGIPTVLVLPIPKFGEWDLGGCAMLRVLIDPTSCAPPSRTRAQADDARRMAMRAERAALSMVETAEGLDLADDLCPDGVCQAYRDGRWWWKDGRHLSVEGALLLTDRFVAAINTAASQSP